MRRGESVDKREKGSYGGTHGSRPVPYLLIFLFSFFFDGLSEMHSAVSRGPKRLEQFVLPQSSLH